MRTIKDVMETPEGLQEIRTVAFCYFFNQYKEGHRHPEFPNGGVQMSVTQAVKLLEEFAEWDSVMPGYTDDLVARYLDWEEQFLKTVIAEKLQIPLSFVDDQDGGQ